MENRIQEQREAWMVDTYEGMKGLYNLVEENSEEEVQHLKETITSLSEKIPMYIQHNGLLRTMQFLKSNEDEKEKKQSGVPKTEAGIKAEYYKIISYLVMKEYDTKVDLVTYLLDKKNLEQKKYRILTRKTLEIAIWLKRNNYQF